MTKREFIREHRTEISDMVANAFGENCRPTNDGEREDWLLNDEGLYNWARSEGVNL